MRVGRGFKKKLEEAGRYWARGGKHALSAPNPDKAIADLVRAGAPPEVIATFAAGPEDAPSDEDEDFAIWPEHQRAVELFLRAADCWEYAGMDGRPARFDVQAANTIWSGTGQKPKPQEFQGALIVARGALAEWTEQAAEEHRKAKGTRPPQSS